MLFFYFIVSSYANRGNVAIIVWNTIEAPAVWDVTGTEYEGSINLSDSGKRSLLSIYFRDYINNDNELKEFEVQINENDVTENQIKLSSTAEGIKDIKWDAQPRRNLKTQSYKVDGENFVKVYVPETVCEDLADLHGEYVTFILGEDNIAVAVLVDEDESAKDFLTAYDSIDQKITVGGENYSLVIDDPDTAGTVEKCVVTLNGTTKDGSSADWTLANALTALNVASTDYEDIEKAVEATLTLDDEGDVKTLELFASFDEVIVTEINETSKRYEIKTNGEEIEWKLEDEEDGDIDFPKVYIDGKNGDIRDIQVGNVLTFITAGNTSDIKYGTTAISKIYVSTKTVEGEVTKISTSSKAIKIDGTTYLPTAVGATYETISKEIEEANWTNSLTSADVLDNENVTLFLNIFGEYVGVWYTEAKSDYQYGVVTAIVGGSIGWEEIDGEDYATKGIRVLLENGEIERFTVKTNADDSDYLSETQLGNLIGTGKTIDVGAQIMFMANDDVIMLGKHNGGIVDEIQIVKTEGDNIVTTVNNGTTVTGKKFTANDSKSLTYTTNTKIFNYKASDGSIKEIVSDWDSIISSNQLALNGPATVVYDKDTLKVLYMFVDSNYTSSDYEFAVVDSMLEEVRDGKWLIDFVGETDVEVADDVAITNETNGTLVNKQGWLVKYTTKGGEVDSAFAFIDTVTERDDEDLIASYILEEGTGSGQLNLDSKFGSDVTFAQLKVKEVYVDGDDYVDITFGKAGDSKVSNAKFMFGTTGTNYTLETNGDYNKVSTAYDATKTYYRLTETEVDQAQVTVPVSGVKYYTKSSDNYVLASSSLSAWASATTYYTLEAVELADMDAALGQVVLVNNNTLKDVKAYDLRDGDVKEFTLTNDENPGFSAVVYTEGTTSYVFIID